jgi:hypothetical protein
VCKQVTVCPGHIWTTLYRSVIDSSYIYLSFYKAVIVLYYAGCNVLNETAIAC